LCFVVMFVCAVLGLPYNEALDVWSVGCILYELYTGKILFPGNNNNEMLRLHQELKGPFPNRMVKKGQFRSKHFDDDFVFEQSKKDPITGIVRPLSPPVWFVSSQLMCCVFALCRLVGVEKEDQIPASDQRDLCAAARRWRQTLGAGSTQVSDDLSFLLLSSSGADAFV
jgi:serine/threonine protein kinase